MEKKNNPILFFLVIVALLALAHYVGGLRKENQLLKKGSQPDAQQPTQTQPTEAENPLSEENLRKYAQELKLDLKSYDQCLASDKYDQWMDGWGVDYINDEMKKLKEVRKNLEEMGW